MTLPLHSIRTTLPGQPAGARDLSRRNVSTAQTRPQNSKASFQHRCGLKSALRRSRGDHAKQILGAGRPDRVFGEGAEHCTRGACAPDAKNVPASRPGTPVQKTLLQLL